MTARVKGGGYNEFIDHIYSMMPSFTDVFTEETFYIFVICFVLLTLIVAYTLSRFITIKPVE